MSNTKSNQQQLFETFLDTTPLKTKGFVLHTIREDGTKDLTGILSANQEVFTNAKSVAISRILDDTNNNIPASYSSLDFIKQGISKLCKKEDLWQTKLNDAFTAVMLVTKGESVNTNAEFNYPTLVFSTNPSMLLDFNKAIIDTHVESQISAKNFFSKYSHIAHRIVPLNETIAIGEYPTKDIQINTIEDAKNIVDGIDNSTDRITSEINQMINLAPADTMVSE